MIITHKLTLPLDCREAVQSIEGVQGDTVRVLEISLTEQGEAWIVPERATAVIRYRRVRGGAGGTYDTMPDGATAYTIHENLVTLQLAPQIFSVAGPVELQVTLSLDGAEVTSFSMMVYVQGNLCETASDKENYVNLSEHIYAAAVKAVEEVMPAVLPSPAALSVNGVTYDGSAAVDVKVAKKEHSIIYIEGDSESWVEWTGTSEDITEYFDGLTIAYRTNVMGHPGGTSLNINGLGAVKLRRNATGSVSQEFPINTVLMLTYTTINGVGYWQMADYCVDRDTKNTTGSSEKADSKLYLVGATAQYSTGAVTYSNSGCYVGVDNCLYSGGEKVMVAADVTAMIDAALADIAVAEGVSF